MFFFFIFAYTHIYTNVEKKVISVEHSTTGEVDHFSLCQKTL